MSRLPAPENPIPDVETVDVDDKHDHGDEEPATSIIPVARVDKSDPVVTRRELWSYYRTSSVSHTRFTVALSVATILIASLIYSLLQWRQRRRPERLLHDALPVARLRRRL